MQDSVDIRRLRITVYDNLYEANIKQMTEVSLPGGLVELDEISSQIREELMRCIKERAGISQYEITDTRRETQIGAGAHLQEIMLALASGTADGLASGAVAVLIQRILDWCIRKYGKKKDPSGGISGAIETSRSFVTRHFSPEGILELVDASGSDTGYRVELRDQTGSTYTVEMGNQEPQVISARRE